MTRKISRISMTNADNTCHQMIAEAQNPAGVKEVMNVFERFQEAYIVTEQYLGMLSPKTLQSNSNQSFLAENK